MKVSTLRFQIYPLRTSSSTRNPSLLLPFNNIRHPRHASAAPLTSGVIPISKQTARYPFKTSLVDKPPVGRGTSEQEILSAKGSSRYVILGAVSVGLALLLWGMEEQKALAFGPEGPLVEEFWDNVRRYAIYALTVSTGALYTIFLPIVELLKNPISAILLLIMFGGSIYIVSQVLSAMVGVSDFTYDYGY